MPMRVWRSFARGFWIACVLMIVAPTSDAQSLATTSLPGGAADDPAPETVSSHVSRGAPSLGLASLYATFVGLQALDLQSTSWARQRGGTEGNPVMALSAETPYLVALKGLGTFSVVFATEKIRKKHPVTAVVMMVGLNLGYSMIVAHNLSVASGR
jgi:hypothetical protein